MNQTTNKAMKLLLATVVGFAIVMADPIPAGSAVQNKWRLEIDGEGRAPAMKDTKMTESIQKLTLECEYDETGKPGMIKIEMTLCLNERLTLPVSMVLSRENGKLASHWIEVFDKDIRRMVEAMDKYENITLATGECAIHLDYFGRKFTGLKQGKNVEMLGPLKDRAKDDAGSLFEGFACMEIDRVGVFLRFLPSAWEDDEEQEARHPRSCMPAK